MTNEILISCDRVSKRFCRDFKRSLRYGCYDSIRDILGLKNGFQSRGKLRKDEFLSVSDVSFELRRGESLGLIGRNGAGKTTLLKVLNGLIAPDRGCVSIRGRVGALIALGAGFDPVLTARENIMVNGAILGLSRSRIREVFDSIIDFAGIEKFVDSPVRTFSSGMKVRLGFAIAAHVDPDILLIDEVLAVGDLEFRRKCLKFVRNFAKNGGSSILVTHNLNQILSSCDRAILLENGKVAADGPSSEVVHKATELQYESSSDSDGMLSSKKWVASEGQSFAILAARVVDGDGGNPRSGKPAFLEMEILCRERAEDLSWAAYFWTDDYSRRLLTLRGSDDGQVETVDAGKTYLLSCKLPTLPLSPGRFGVRFAVIANGTAQDTVGYEDEYLSVIVEPGGTSRSETRRSAVGDLVWTQCEWLDAREIAR